MNLHRLDFVSLSLFASVVRSGSISKGAEAANLVVGAASKRMSALEETVGTALFERHSRGVTLTPAGQALFQHAQRILADVDHLSADLSDYAAGIVGVVRLWANTSAVTQFLPGQLAAFSSLNPGIRIELEEQNSREVVMAVADGRADLCVFADRTPEMGLSVLPYAEDRLVLVVPADHTPAPGDALPFEAALEHDFVCLSEGTSIAQRLQTEADALGRRIKVRIRVRSFDAMCQMVAAGLGVAVLPLAAIQPHVRSMGLRHLLLTDAWAQRRLLLGVRDREALSRSARLLVGHLTPSPAAGG